MDRNRGFTRTNRDVADDPFGPDGFGDSWDRLNGFNSDSDEEIFQLVDCDAGEGTDWTRKTSTSRRKEQAEADAASKQKREEYLRKERAAAAKFLAQELEKQEKKEAMAAQRHAGMLFQWNCEVERAKDYIALAKPEDALGILYALIANEAFEEAIDQKVQQEIQQMYNALWIHFQFHKCLLIVETEESSKDELRSTLSRNENTLSSQDGSTSTLDHSTIGGDTVKVNHSTEDSELETGKDAVVVIVADQLS